MLFGRSKEIDMEGRKIVVSKARCPENHRCPSVRVCPVDALKQNGFSAPEVDHGKCIKCGKCIRSCPMRAIKAE